MTKDVLEGNELNTGEKRNITLWQQGSGFPVLWKSVYTRTKSAVDSNI